MFPYKKIKNIQAQLSKRAQAQNEPSAAVFMHLIQAILDFLDLFLIWRTRKDRKAKSDRLATAVWASSDWRQIQLSHVEFHCFEDTLRHSPSAFIRTQVHSTDFVISAGWDSRLV